MGSRELRRIAAENEVLIAAGGYETEDGAHRFRPASERVLNIRKRGMARSSGKRQRTGQTARRRSPSFPAGRWPMRRKQC